jgi:hypothetical protein
MFVPLTRNGLGCGGGCGCGPCSGLGFESALDTSSLTGGQLFGVDTSSWDWHEWALVAIGVYVAGKWAGGKLSSGARAVARPFEARTQRKRKIKAAARRYKSELERLSG